MSFRVLHPTPRKPIHDAILYMLNQKGKTIDMLDKKDLTLHGDSAEIKFKNKPIWHAREKLLESIATKLNISTELYGPNRISSSFHNIVDQEITKYQKNGTIVKWSSSKNLGVIRLGKKLSPSEIDFKGEIDNTLTNAEYSLMDITEDDMRRTFTAIISRGKKANTYKFALAKALLDYCRDNTDDTNKVHKIPYQYFSTKFLEYYWYQEYKFRMKQDFKIHSEPKVISSIRKIFNENPPADFKLIDQNKKEKAEKEIRGSVFGHAKLKTSLVIPRFQNIPKNGQSPEYRIFYEYNDEKQMIELKPEAFKFFKENNAILSKANLAEWAKFLERINNSLPLLIAKIDEPNMTRGSLVEFHKIYSEHTDSCFYCCNKLEKTYTDVDHFIPWSYIFDDNAWNLVLACRDCNCKKSNYLPEEEFKNMLIQRNFKYSNLIKKLERSLSILNRGKGWDKEIENHYTTCSEYGFGTITLP